MCLIRGDEKYGEGDSNSDEGCFGIRATKVGVSLQDAIADALRDIIREGTFDDMIDTEEEPVEPFASPEPLPPQEDVEPVLAF